MEGNAYNAIEDSIGDIELIDTVIHRSVYFQGEDADIFREEWDTIIKIWTRRYGTFKNGSHAYRKSFGPYNSYKEHFDAIADQYADVMEDTEDME